MGSSPSVLANLRKHNSASISSRTSSYNVSVPSQTSFNDMFGYANMLLGYANMLWMMRLIILLRFMQVFLDFYWFFTCLDRKKNRIPPASCFPTLSTTVALSGDFLFFIFKNIWKCWFGECSRLVVRGSALHGSLLRLYIDAAAPDKHFKSPKRPFNCFIFPEVWGNMSRHEPACQSVRSRKAHEPLPRVFVELILIKNSIKIQSHHHCFQLKFTLVLLRGKNFPRNQKMMFNNDWLSPPNLLSSEDHRSISFINLSEENLTEFYED